MDWLYLCIEGVTCHPFQEDGVDVHERILFGIGRDKMIRVQNALPR